MDHQVEPTDQEIEETLKEMGYNLNIAQFQDLKQRLEFEDDESAMDDSFPFTSYLNDPIAEALTPARLRSTNRQYRPFPASRPTSANAQEEEAFASGIKELMAQGNKCLRNIYEDIQQMTEHLLSAENAGPSGQQRIPYATPTALNTPIQRNKVGTEDDENIEEAEKENTFVQIEELTSPENRRRWKEYRNEHALRDVQCPPPGRMPFKHDPVKRLEKYREEWSKFPIPNEEKRLKLRWQIRNAMMKRDIPIIKMAVAPKIVQRQEWK
jgi:hypothetical protein